ncbi:unnamed protein product, partial [Laminaria digitata]
QVSFAASTVDGLSRWAGEAMETLGHERDRARALHRENAQVSREATMAQKEIMSLEAKLFHSGKEVDVAKAYAVQLKSESGDMKSVVSAIQDSVLAAGMGIKMHGEDGEPLRGSRAVFGMIRALRDVCISRQDQIARLDQFLDEAKTELEQAEVTIKHMAKAASSKRPRKKGAAAAATSTTATTAKNLGTDSSNINKGPSRQTATALATAAAVTLSSSAGAARALRSHTATPGHGGGGTDNPNASPSGAGTGKESSPSAVEAGGRESSSLSKMQSAAVSAVLTSGAERSPAVVSAPASSKVSSETNDSGGGSVAAAASYGGRTMAARRDDTTTMLTTLDGSTGTGDGNNHERGKKPVAINVTPVVTPMVATPTVAQVRGGGSSSSSPEKEGTGLVSVSSEKRAGDHHGRGSQPSALLSSTASPRHQTDPSSTSVGGGEPGEGGDGDGGRSSTERAKRLAPKESTAPTAAAAVATVNPRSIEGGGRIDNKHSGGSLDGEVKTAGGANRHGGECARRDGGGIDGPLTAGASEEREDAYASDHLLSEVWNENCGLAGGGGAEIVDTCKPMAPSKKGKRGTVDDNSPVTASLAIVVLLIVGISSPPSIGRLSANLPAKISGEFGLAGPGERHRACTLPFIPSCDGDSNTGSLSDGAVGRTLEKATRSTADAMSGLEDALKQVLGSSSGIDARVREEITAALRNEARLMRDTIKRDMEEVAAEAVAVSAERSNFATELGERAERISQLGSNIHDLQGGLVNVDRVHPTEYDQREGQAVGGGGGGGGYHPGGMHEQRGPTGTRVPSSAEQTGANKTRGTTVGGTADTARDAPRSAPGLYDEGSSNDSIHGSTRQWHPREEDERRLEDGQQHHGNARRHDEFWAEGSVVQGGFGNSLREEESRRGDGRGQSRPHSEGARGCRREDRGGGSEGVKRRVPGEAGAMSSNTSVVQQRGRGAIAGTMFSQQQQDRNGEPRVGSASSRQRQGNPQNYQSGSKLSAERGGGGGGGDGEGGGRADGKSVGSRMTPTPHGLPADAYSRDVSGASSDRVGGSRGLSSSRDRSTPPRALDGGLDKGGVQGNQTRGGGDGAFDQQANVRQGQYEPDRGKRGGGGEDGGLRAARGNEPARLTTPPRPDDVGYAKNNSQRDNNATPVVGGAVRASAAANVSPVGQSGPQRRLDDITKGGKHVDSANDGTLKGGGGGGGGKVRTVKGAPTRSGSPSPEHATTTTTTAPSAVTLKSAQDRPKIQHMAKTMSEVAIAAAGGAADTSPERKSSMSDTEREPRKGAAVAGAAEVREGDGKGGAAEAGKGMTDRQERALRAFLKGADETQANLAFVALRQEPFLVEEFDYLANQIQDLHETTNGPVPRHLPHAELRDRLRELSARSAPLLRRVRARYRRLHVRWASKLLEALSTRGLTGGDADVSLTCALCGYDWRSAQPR